MRRTIIKVFLASPGDLIDERKAAKKIVDEENRNHATPQDFQFELVGWEDTVAQHGRAQEVINRDLDQCNYFVGMLWKRWGSPPGTSDGSYTSGFEEEYERSEKRFKSTRKPEISLLFKSIDSSESNDAGPQLKKVLDFKNTFTERYRGVYHTFQDLRDFEDRFRSILALYLRKELAENSKIEAERRSRTLEVQDDSGLEKPDQGERLFENEVEEFVQGLVSRRSKSEEPKYSSAEVARFRLLGVSLGHSGNDNAVIGVHDANILYKKFRAGSISKRERRALLEAGLRNFSAQNAPLWTWLWKLGDSPLQAVTFRTFVGPNDQRKGAFQLLAMMPDELSDQNQQFDRNHFLKLWLENDDSELVIAALSYLGRRGVNSDLSHIDELLDSDVTTISKAAVSTKINILGREGIQLALEYISTSQDAEIPDSFTEAVFTNQQSIETNLLRSCLSNQSIKFRRKLAQELFNRTELNEDDASTLFQSTDAETRMLGSQIMNLSGSSYSLSDAQAHITKPKKLNMLAAFSNRNPDLQSLVAFEEYKHLVLCTYKQDALEEQLKTEGLYSHDITFALYDKCFQKYQAAMINNLDDGFSSFLENKYSEENPSVLPDKSIDDFVRNKMIQLAIGIVSAKGYRDGIQVVRKAIDKGGVEYSDKIVRYFEKFGNWEDVPRVIRLCDNFPHYGVTLISIANQNLDYISSARTILKLGKNRIADVLSMNMPAGLWNAVIASMSKGLFVSFDDERILVWLRGETDTMRKSVALKSVICLPKSRIERLVNAYIADDQQYYYNVVFWLDLGLALDRSRSIKVANNAMAEL